MKCNWKYLPHHLIISGISSFLGQPCIIINKSKIPRLRKKRFSFFFVMRTVKEWNTLPAFHSLNEYNLIFLKLEWIGSFCRLLLGSHKSKRLPVYKISSWIKKNKLINELISNKLKETVNINPLNKEIFSLYFLSYIVLPIVPRCRFYKRWHNPLPFCPQRAQWIPWPESEHVWGFLRVINRCYGSSAWREILSRYKRLVCVFVINMITFLMGQNDLVYW